MGASLITLPVFPGGGIASRNAGNANTDLMHNDTAPASGGANQLV